ncbi:MAG: hypothetical protein K0R57_3789 [Paenibacillaceae bacterium]|jgi:transcriptional pleiotropic regulator of transition state genes|nr:hypothetical protein [Paenibacillaceae bacterium]
MNDSRKTFGIVRELDSLGRIVIPKETRDLLGIRLEDPVEFFSDDNSIIVRRYRSNCCIFCLESDDVILFREHLVCRKCMVEVLEQAAERPAPVPDPLVEDKRRSQTERLKLIQSLLQEQPGLRQHELARMLGISQGYVSQLLSKLEEL